MNDLNKEIEKLKKATKPEEKRPPHWLWDTQNKERTTSSGMCFCMPQYDENGDLIRGMDLIETEQEEHDGEKEDHLS